MAKPDVTEQLKRVPLFRTLDRKELEQIARLAKEQRYFKDSTIVQDGATGHGLYVILEGDVSVQKDGRTLARMGPGDFFGEMAVLDDGPRTADVTAERDTVCLVIVSWDIRPLLMENAGMTYKMLQEVVRRLRTSGPKVQD